MIPYEARPDARSPAPRRRRRIVLLLVTLAVLAIAWTSPVLFMTPDDEGRALIAAGVPRSDFPALIAEGGTAYAADTLAHDWAESCERQADSDDTEAGWLQRLAASAQRVGLFGTRVDCERVRAIALRTDALRDAAEDDACTDEEQDERDDAVAAPVDAAHHHRPPAGRRRHGVHQGA